MLIKNNMKKECTTKLSTRERGSEIEREKKRKNHSYKIWSV